METWSVTFRVHRQKGDQPGHFQNFMLEVSPDEYVLDAIERIWAFHDRSLVYRHACHHSACGACAMRVNGVEKLTCITHIREVASDHSTVRVEPLRNFPVVSDLAVDMESLYQRMELAQYDQVTPVGNAPLGEGIKPAGSQIGQELLRLNDCIECGCCISACSSGFTHSGYLGPAVIAAIQYQIQAGNLAAVDWADSEVGLWRCHSMFECTAVCPSYVEPAWRIMDLRKRLVGERVKRIFSGRGKELL